VNAKLTTDGIARFERDGIAFPLPVFGEDEIGERFRALQALEQERAGRLPPLLNFKPYLLVPWLWEMIHDARIVDPVQDLLGEDILCWEASFFSKAPGDGAFVTWHQDATYWGLSENIGVTAWVAFTPSTRESGCMRVVAGSHRSALTHRTVEASGNMLPLREAVAPPVDESKAVDVELAPGEMSLHHPMVVHGSAPNASANRRVGLAIRYISARIRQRGEARGTAVLVRGRDHGHFDLEQPPEAPFHPEARARHAVLLRRWMTIVKAETLHSKDPV
jgi:non-haem Fe2+, alpha-ketoglutarate-dependent halogenase